MRSGWEKGNNVGQIPLVPGKGVGRTNYTAEYCPADTAVEVFACILYAKIGLSRKTCGFTLAIGLLGDRFPGSHRIGRVRLLCETAVESMAGLCYNVVGRSNNNQL